MESYYKSLEKGIAAGKSFNDEELWNYLGDRGVFSESPESLRTNFDILVHRNGLLFYQLKYTRDRSSNQVIENINIYNPLFKKISFHDPMETFLIREWHDKDSFAVMITHNGKGDEYDYLETWLTLPYDKFSKYLNKDEPMSSFMDDVLSYIKK